jgi:hypothetical protein
MFPVSPRVPLPRVARGSVALAVCASALILGSAASAQGPATLTLKELTKGSTFAFIDSPPMSNSKGEPKASLGDRIVFTNPLVSPAGKRLGRLYLHCTVVVAAQQANKAAFACEGVIALAGETLSVQTLLPHAGRRPPGRAPRRRRTDFDARADSRARRHFRHRIRPKLRHDRQCATTAR